MRTVQVTHETANIRFPKNWNVCVEKVSSINQNKYKRDFHHKD